MNLQLHWFTKPEEQVLGVILALLGIVGSTSLFAADVSGWKIPADP